MREAHQPVCQSGRLLEGRVALVTGASRGIGAATAKLLAESGASVAVNYYQNEETARQVIESIEEAGGEAIPVRADAREKREVEAMVREVEERFGDIDTLILNATTADLRPGPLVDQDSDSVVGIVENQLRLVLSPLKAAVPSMVERGGGCVVAVGSLAAQAPVEGMSPVSIAKAAMEAALKCAALELGPHGIRVNVVAPGLVLTELNDWMPQSEKDAGAAATPLRRNALPEDVARAILMLASDHATFVTGASLPVSGGMHLF